MRRSLGILALSFTACLPLHAGWRLEGNTTYTPPEKSSNDVSARVLNVDAARDAVWTAAVSYLSQTAFAIDQLSKESGLIAIKFSEPDPRRFIDCGALTSWVSNMRGRRDYTIEGAQPQAAFEQVAQGKLLGVERSVTLSGVINIFVLATDASHTSVRVNVRYVAQKRSVIHDRAAEIVNNAVPAVVSSAITFNSGEIGSDDGGAPTKCVSRLALEKQILEGIASELSKLAPSGNASPK